MVITGVIRPPPEIRAVADRTALYVAKNGRAFESRILNSTKAKTPKFAFLQTSSPFHAYYEDRIQFYENNGGKEEEDEKEKSDKKSDEKATKENDETKNVGEENNRRVAVKKKAAMSAAIDPVAKALLTQRQKIAQIRSSAARKSTTTSEKEKQEGVEEAAEIMEAPEVLPVAALEPPPALHFINIIAPASLSVAQIETIQLVAQLTALDGKGGAFLQQLTFREWNNPTYSFCHPRSGHFAYFSALVDAYRRVLTLWTTPTNTNTNSSTILIAASQMAKDKDDKVDEMANNVQKCLELAAYHAEYKRDLVQQRKQQQQDAAADSTPVAALVDWHDFVVVETIDFPADQQVVTLPPPPPPPPLPVQETATGGMAGGDDMNDSDDEEEDEDAAMTEEQIRVVPKYTPKVVSAAAAAQRAKEQMTMIDPISGKSVAIKDMPEHLRIQLLDPKWALERKKFQDKQKESNLVSADTFADNVAKFAQARGMTSNRTTTDQDLLNETTDASSNKMRLQDANRILRQQALHPSTSVGPSLPGVAATAGTRGPSFHHAPPTMDSSMQPDLKRPRLDALQLPPPLHASAAVPPPPPPPPASAVSAAATTSYPTTYVLAPPGFEAGLPPPPPPPVGEDPFAAAATPTTTDADGADDAAPGGTEGELLSEADFVASLPKPLVTLQIRIPNDQTQMAWNFYGQIVALSSVHVMSTVKAVKQELSRTHLNGMPANKIQLKLSSNNTFLKDSLTLAALNLGGPTSTNTTLELVPKTRGGRK